MWDWRAECISLRETLPIDEAGERAEKTIKHICMNTPEKLTMWGVQFRKADPDAELKPITPQAWQGLWINPLYNRATNGEYGKVIWTGLCFDRKQLVAAFGGGNEPTTHTPAARLTRRQPFRERAFSHLAERYPNGVPDRSSKSDAALVRAVKNQIKKRGELDISRDTILRAAGRRK